MSSHCYYLHKKRRWRKRRGKKNTHVITRLCGSWSGRPMLECGKNTSIYVGMWPLWRLLSCVRWNGVTETKTSPKLKLRVLACVQTSMLTRRSQSFDATWTSGKFIPSINRKVSLGSAARRNQSRSKILETIKTYNNKNMNYLCSSGDSRANWLATASLRCQGNRVCLTGCVAKYIFSSWIKHTHKKKSYEVLSILSFQRSTSLAS